jgi:hypothetical protein
MQNANDPMIPLHAQHFHKARRAGLDDLDVYGPLSNKKANCNTFVKKPLTM